MFENFGIQHTGIEKEFDTDSYASEDTIVAQATAVGFGGVGIVRVSGSAINVEQIVKKILKTKSVIKPRYAYYGNFHSVSSKVSNKNNYIIDKGIALYFNAPHSYTGEDVFELHCHGGPVVIENLIQQMVKLGARIAEPGEFTKRAWLNGKMDLAQVEAVSDLINATSFQAARSAANTLVGNFSEIINNFLLELISLRTYVEAAIDFSEEQIDFIADGEVLSRINVLLNKLEEITATTKQGVILQEGVNIVIAGKPNSGKSSLLNLLSRTNQAIVTDIPGTTRDIIKTHINIKGLPISLIDTAGIRNTDDIVEQEGVRRAKEAVLSADFLVIILDVNLYRNNRNNRDNRDACGEWLDVEQIIRDNLGIDINNINNDEYKYLKKIIEDKNYLILLNKIDLIEEQDYISEVTQPEENLGVSVLESLTGINNKYLEQIENYIIKKTGFKQTTEGSYIARRRHLENLKQVRESLDKSKNLLINNCNQDLIAEELRLAQEYLGNITGEYSSDDLLGSIFSSFCVGK